MKHSSFKRDWKFRFEPFVLNLIRKKNELILFNKKWVNIVIILNKVKNNIQQRGTVSLYSVEELGYGCFLIKNILK